MSLTNIAALFSDIVETPQQRQQRLLAEGQASAAQFSELPTGIRELALISLEILMQSEGLELILALIWKQSQKKQQELCLISKIIIKEESR